MVNHAITKEQRQAIQEAIDRLITILDEVEGDADFEPDADNEETFDQEQCCEDEGAQCDDEGARDCDREDGNGV